MRLLLWFSAISLLSSLLVASIIFNQVLTVALYSVTMFASVLAIVLVGASNEGRFSKEVVIKLRFSLLYVLLPLLLLFISLVVSIAFNYQFITSIIGLITVFVTVLLLMLLLARFLGLGGLYIFILFYVINLVVLCSLLYAIHIRLGVELAYSLLAVVLLLMGLALFAYGFSFKSMLVVNLRVSLMDVVVFLLSLPLVLVSLAMFLGYGFGGAFWDDVYKYASMLYSYRFSGFARLFYVLLQGFHGFWMELFGLSYVDAYRLFSWLNVIQPLSIAFFVESLLVSIGASKRFTSMVTALSVLFICYANNLLLPFTLTLLSISRGLGESMLSYAGVIRVMVVGRLGIPGLIPHVLWLKAGGLGLSLLFSSIGLLFRGLRTSKSSFLFLGLALLVFSLYASNFVLTINLSILLLYLLYLWARRTRPSDFAKALLLVLGLLALLEYLFKFMLYNVFFNIVGGLSLVSVPLLLLLIHGFKTSENKNGFATSHVPSSSTSIRFIRLVFTLLAVLLVIAFVYSNLLLAKNLLNINYSDMWIRKIPLPLYLVFARSLASPVIALIFSSLIVVLFPSILGEHHVRWLRVLSKYLLLMVSGILLACIVSLVYGYYPNIVVSRSTSYLLVPVAILSAYMVSIIFRRFKFLVLVSVLALLMTSLITVFYCIEGLYIDGVIRGNEIYNEVTSLLNTVYSDKEWNGVLGVTSRYLEYVTLSLTRPNTKVINIVSLYHNVSINISSRLLDVASTYALLKANGVNYVISRKGELESLSTRNPALYSVLKSSISFRNSHSLSKIPYASHTILIEDYSMCNVIDSPFYSWLLSHGIISANSLYIRGNISSQILTAPSLVLCGNTTLSTKPKAYASLKVNVNGDGFLNTSNTDNVLWSIHYKPYILEPRRTYQLNLNMELSREAKEYLVYVFIRYDPNMYDKVTVSSITDNVSLVDSFSISGLGKVYVFSSKSRNVELRVNARTRPRPANAFMLIKVIAVKLDLNVYDDMLLDYSGVCRLHRLCSSIGFSE